MGPACLCVVRPSGTPGPRGEEEGHWQPGAAPGRGSGSVGTLGSEVGRGTRATLTWAGTELMDHLELGVGVDLVSPPETPEPSGWKGQFLQALTLHLPSTSL